jgi:hypothetical protein
VCEKWLCFAISLFWRAVGTEAGSWARLRLGRMGLPAAGLEGIEVAESTVELAFDGRLVASELIQELRGRSSPGECFPA